MYLVCEEITFLKDYLFKLLMRLILSKIDYPSLESVCKLLYDKHYQDVLEVNENGNFQLARMDNKYYCLDNLFGGTYAVDLQQVYNDVFLHNYILDLNNYYVNASEVCYKIISGSIQLDFKTFCGYTITLANLIGEYNGSVFDILQNDQEWRVLFKRMEGRRWGSGTMVFYNMTDSDCEFDDYG